MKIKNRIMFPMLLLTVLLSGCQKNDPVPLEEVQTPGSDTVNLSESSCTNALMGDLENGADVFAFADDQLNTLVAAGALDPVENAESVRQSNLPEAVAAASVDDTLYALPLTADNGYFLYYDK